MSQVLLNSRKTGRPFQAGLQEHNEKAEHFTVMFEVAKMRGPAARNGRRNRCVRRRPAMLTFELCLTLPILLVVGIAIVQFSLMLLGSQAISAAAHAGAREACLPGASSLSVVRAVENALQGYSFQNNCEVLIFVNNQPETVSALSTAITGDSVGVTVRVGAPHVAPNSLLLIGISIADTTLQQTFVMRKE